MPKPNDRIGPYQLERKLGKGAFGEVWLAHDVDNLVATRAVALKLPLDDDVNLDAIRQEAQVWVAASGHPNVLPMLEARVYNGQVVIASEYAPDGSLQQWLTTNGGQAPSLEAALEMTRGILDGLAHLHSRTPRIIHRDLKPDNILLNGTTPRLADFGLSRVLRSTSMSEIVAGTPIYMAPEAFKGKRNQQTDLWSVGVMLYQLLSGRFPFVSNDKYELHVRIVNDEPAPLVAPVWLQQVVAKALSKDPALRFQTTEEMRAALVESNPVPLCETKPRSKLESPAASKVIDGSTLLRPAPLKPKPPPRVEPVPQPARAALKRKPQSTDISKPLKAIIGLGSAGALSGMLYWASNRETPATVTTMVPSVTTTPSPTMTLSSSAPAAGKDFTETVNGVKLAMKAVPAGAFILGSSDDSDAERNDSEGPLHVVTLSDFLLGKYEITQAQWQAVMEDNPSEIKGPNLPVENVSWDEAKTFCQMLSQMTGKLYRLPTEAEWEFAARAYTLTPFAFGSSLSSKQANFDGEVPYGRAAKGVYRGQTAKVGIFKPNEFGLYDMHGNVREWCDDVWHDNYNGAPTNGSSWLSGGNPNLRVLRGGS